jgi:hypothetical protein
MIIIKYILKKSGRRKWAGFIWLEIGTLHQCCCEYG